MKTITFESFLKNYIKKLSTQNTLNIRRLAIETEENPRLLHPFILYCYFCIDRDVVNRRLINNNVLKIYKLFSKKYPTKKIALKYLQNTKGFLDDFQKVYKSFIVRTNQKRNEYELKYKLRKKILLLQKEKNISTAMILKNDKLQLNKGNVYGFMRGNVNLMSFKKIHSILIYLINEPKRLIIIKDKTNNNKEVF